MEPWPVPQPGVVRFPSGRLVRGRGLREPCPEDLAPSYTICLLRRPPPPMPWESRWLRWPDFGLPADDIELGEALLDGWRRAPSERVEVACAGGRGRTGTALAALAVLDGLSAAEAIGFVRRSYHPRAVETPGQGRWVSRFAAQVGGSADGWPFVVTGE